jgi:hypothetical protein
MIIRKQCVRLPYFAISVIVFCLLFIAGAVQASLYFSPTSVTRSVNQTFSATVKVNSDGQSINAAQGSIVFDPYKVEVTGISKSGSIFNLWTQEPVFSNTEGTVDFEGGLPNPGFSGAAGTILTISFRTKTATTVNGYTDINIVSGAILANDGLGTNILTSLGKLTLTITPGVNSSVTTEAPVSAGSESPIVSSSTHPDSTKWYSNNSPQFSWTLPSDVTGVSYLITEKPVSNPGPNSDGLISKASALNLADGTHYLHVKFKRNGAWGPITHFQFNIDTTPPLEFEMTMADAVPTATARDITFKTTDSMSGIDHYEVKANDKTDWETVTNDKAGQSYVINLNSGVNNVQVKAVDSAGNSVMASKNVDVTASPTISFGGWFSKPFDWLANILTRFGLFIVFIVALIGLILLGFRLIGLAFNKISISIKATHSHKKGERQSNHVMNKLLGDMQDEIKFLNSIAKRRHLVPEEKYLKSKLEQYLKVLKDFNQ